MFSYKIDVLIVNKFYPPHFGGVESTVKIHADFISEKMKKKHIKQTNNFDKYNCNYNVVNKPKNTNKNKRILSCSPSVSFTNYKPPPSSSYNEKLTNLLKLYNEKNKVDN